ncbi:MAG: hypothetical protein JWM74_488 [Myxococcaceae bacterium]|nr:hypothetical protein [Myxococcaceae bacterium]
MRILMTLVCGLATIAIACGGGAKPADTASDAKSAPAAPAGPMSEAEVETACGEIAKNDAQCSTQSGVEEKAKGQCTRGVACMRDFLRADAIRPFLDCSRASACDHDKCMEETEGKLAPTAPLTAFLAKCEASCGTKVECKKVAKRILKDDIWPAATKCFDENADCQMAAVCTGMQLVGFAGKGMACIETAAREPGATASSASPVDASTPESTTIGQDPPKKGAKPTAKPAKPTPKPTRKK